MSDQYIVRNSAGLLVRSQMDTTNAANIIRKMSNGEGFTVYQVINQPNGYTWGRLSNNPGDLSQQYCCLSILGRTPFAVTEPAQTTPIPSTVYPSIAWVNAVDGFLRLSGYEGPKP